MLRTKDSISFEKGFTLIELLVVIAIIGLLSTLAIVALGSARMKSRDTRRLSDLKQIQTAFEMYNNENNGTYPATTTVLGNIEHACLTSSGFQPGGSCGGAYINFPKDPSGGYYSYTGGGTDYAVYANLEGTTNDLSGQVAVSGNRSVYATNIVGWWKFDEGTGLAARDSSGFGTELYITGSSPSLITWVPGRKSGTAIKLDPAISRNCVTGTVMQSDSVSEQIKKLFSGNFSVNEWVYDYSGTGFFHLTTNFSAPSFNGVWVFHTNARAANNAYTMNQFYFSYPTGTTSWHMFTYVFDLGTMTHSFYEDGQLAGSGTLSGTFGTVNQVNIGSYDDGCADAASGSTIDDFVIYNRALSVPEIQALYESQK